MGELWMKQREESIVFLVEKKSFLLQSLILSYDALILQKKLHVSHLHLLLCPQHSSPPASKERKKKKQSEAVIVQNAKRESNVSETEPGETKDTEMDLCLRFTFVVARS